MGIRYEWKQPCPACGAEMECYYAPSCGFTTTVCLICGAEYNITRNFLLEKKIDRNEG